MLFIQLKHLLYALNSILRLNYSQALDIAIGRMTAETRRISYIALAYLQRRLPAVYFGYYKNSSRTVFNDPLIDLFIAGKRGI